MRRASMILLLLTILWAVDAVVGQGVFWAHDLRHHHLPWRVWAAEVWASGAVPIWSADVGMGFPLMADGQAGVFYLPTMALFLALPAHWALNASILLHLWWAGMGATWMARKLGMERHGALATGIAFAFSGFIAAHTGYLGMQNATAWLPWAVGGLASGSWAVTGLSLAMMLVAGHPQIAAIGLLLVAAVALWRRRLPVFALAAALALAAASPQLIATLELVEHGLREGGVDAAFANIGSLPPQELLNGVLPELFGFDRPGDIAQTYFHRGESYWGMGVNHWEMSFYLGIPVVVLGLIGAAGRRFWVGTAVVALVLMLGGYAPLWPLLRTLPGLEGFRFPVRFAVVLSLAVAVLAGHGLERVLAAEDRRRWVRRVLLSAGVLAVGMSLARVGVHLWEAPLRTAIVDRAMASAMPPQSAPAPMHAAASAPPERLSAEGAARKGDRVLSELKRSTAPTSDRVWWPVLMLLMTAALIAHARRRSLVLGLLLLIYLDLWRFGADYNVRSAPSDATAVPSSVDVMARSMRSGRTATVDRRRSPALDTELITSSMGLVHGTQDVQITSPLRMVRTEALLSRVGLDVGDRGPQKWDRTRANGALLDLLGVRWLLSEHAITDPRYPLRKTGAVKLYENEDPLPGAFVVACALPSADPWADMSALAPERVVVTEGPLAVPRCEDGSGAGRATLTRVSDHEIAIVADTDRQAMLVQTDTHYPGWTATVDGISEPLHRVDLMFRGVIISEGLHEVVLRYEPVAILRALKLAAAAWLVLFTGLALHLRRRLGDARELRRVLGRS